MSSFYKSLKNCRLFGFKVGFSSVWGYWAFVPRVPKTQGSRILGP